MTSDRSFTTKAGVPTIESRIRWTTGRTRSCAGAAAARGVRGIVGGARQVEEVEPLGFVELQGPGDAVEDVLGYAADVPPLEADVVLGADPGEERDLLPAEALDPAVGAVASGGPPGRG